MFGNVSNAAPKIFKGGFARCDNLKYAIFNGSERINNKLELEAKNSVNQWNGITPYVNIKKGDISTAQIILDMGRMDPPSPGKLGKTLFVGADGNNVKTSDRWVKALCIRFNFDGTKENKYATTVHEIGHALSLAHCANAKKHSFHIMHQGLKDSYKVTKYDKKKLKYKWEKRK